MIDERDLAQYPDEGARLAAINAVLPGRWDRDALLAGTSVCIALAVPFRFLAAVVGDRGGLDALFFIIFIAVFVIGAGCAAWVQRTSTPMSHALVVATGTYVVSEGVFVVIRLIRGTEIPWGALVVTLSTVSVGGIIGGFLGNRLQMQGVRPSRLR